MSVPSNLIPVTILGLPEDPSPSDLGWMMYVNNGNTYKVQVNAVLNVSGVPTTRAIIAGTGLTGGGTLASDVTISVAPGGIGASQLNNTGVAAGVYGNSTNFPSLTVDANGRVTAGTTYPIPSTSGFVPTSRQVIAGAGLSGGGTLTSNVTLTANLSDALPLSVGTTSAGISTSMSRADHVHPAIDLTDTTQTDGVLGTSRGGTGTALTAPPNGGIVYSDGSALQVSTVGLTGQVLVSTGAGAPTWGSTIILTDQPANYFYAGPTSGPDAPTSFRAMVNADLPNSGVTANTYGSATVSPVLTVNAKGVVTSATTTTITPAVGSITGLGTGVATWLATPSSANLAAAVTDETGTGALVFANTPTLVTPILGTPTSGTLTNCVGLPITTGVSGLGTNVATFLATPSSSNLAAAVTDETGSGALVFGTNPTLSNPNIDVIDFDTTYSTTLTAGQLGWDGNNTLGLGMIGGNVVQKIGEDQFFYCKATSTITKGQVVMFTGAVGASGVPTGAPATGITDGTYIMGVAAENIATNGFGLIQTFGTLRNVNTSGYADGDILWYNPAVAGGLTKTQPVAPNVKVQMAAVINGGSSGGGTILIRIDPGSVLGGTDSNVQITSVADTQLLQYYGSGQYWRNINPSALIGVGSLANALTIGTGLSGTSYNGSSAVTVAIANSGVTANTYGSASQVPVFAVNAQGQITSVTNTSIAIAYTAVSGLGTAAVLNAGVAGGVATLDGGGTVPTSQLPAAVLGAVKYQGTWNASTNTPTLASGVGTQGYYYVVSVAGSTNLDGISSWAVGDWAIYSGTAWQKIDNTDAVSSVNGYTGTVVLTYSDVGAPSTSGTGATGTWGISISGTAAHATDVAVTADATNTSRYLAFVGATSGNNGVLADADLTYNPSSNTLTVGTLVATTGISGGSF